APVARNRLRSVGRLRLPGISCGLSAALVARISCGLSAALVARDQPRTVGVDRVRRGDAGEVPVMSPLRFRPPERPLVALRGDAHADPERRPRRGVRRRHPVPFLPGDPPATHDPPPFALPAPYPPARSVNPARSANPPRSVNPPRPVNPARVSP